jgi:peptide deformylase
MAKKLKYLNGSLIEYEILPLVDFYDPILRQPTILFDFNTRQDSEYVAYSLAESMSHYGGLGLSANQVGLKDRVCAINMGKEAWVMFNPVIIEKSETLANFSEGCLSYPGLYLKVPRSDHVKVRFQAIGGQFVEKEMDGLTAVCVQHELDHLDGIRYTDLVSSIKLDQAKRKVKATLKKMARIGADVSY